jgi:SAM-dependent methyltransferase
MSAEDNVAPVEDQWTRAARIWSRHRPPLRPHPDDSAVIARVAASLADEEGALTAVILGVTPESAGCGWPANVRLTAFDSSEPMIAALWPPPGAPPNARAELGDWSKLPLAAGEVDLVTGDHTLGCVDWPEGVHAVLAEVRRILRPGGRFVLRMWTRPEVRESLETILADLEADRIESATVVKARFAAWLHTKGTIGIAMADLKDLFEEHFPDRDAAAQRHGWPPETCEMPLTYDPSRRMLMPTLSELRAIVTAYFREADCLTGGYQLAERFPTLVLEPKPL